MKRIIYNLLAFMCFSIGATAQTISVANDVEALASGEDVSFSLHIAGASAMTSTHFKVVLPVALTLGAVEATSAWTALFSSGDDGISAMSTSANAFTGDGDIATIHIVVPANTTTGTYPVTINELRVNGSELTSTAQFNVIVVNRHTVVLDEESTTAPTEATGVDVRVRRTIAPGVWNTICLPFAMSEAQVKAAFGDDVKLGDFTGWTPEYDNDDNVIGIAVVFTEVSAIEKNHPYIIKRPTATTALTEFTADGVTISPDDEPFKSVGKKSQGTLGSFTGTYVAGTAIDEKCLFLNDNKFWYSTGNTTMNAFRAYFYFQDVIASYSAGGSARMRIAFNDEVTEVKDVKQVGDKDGRIYNMQGQIVEQPGRGLYIKDGKVFMNK